MGQTTYEKNQGILPNLVGKTLEKLMIFITNSHWLPYISLSQVLR